MTDESMHDNQEVAAPTVGAPGSGDGCAAEAKLPADLSRPAGCRETALVLAPWQSLLLALVVSFAVWATLEAIMPVFQLPEHLQNFGNDATAERMQEQRVTAALFRARNATVSLVLLGVTLAFTLAAAELWLRGERTRAIGGGILAGLLAGVIAVAAGAIGAALIDHLALPDLRLVKTMIVQSGMLAVLGLAVGMGVSLALFRKQLVATCVGGCMLGGLVAAFLFPIVAGVLLPRMNTEFLMPDPGVGRLVWVGLTAGLIGVTVSGLGSPLAREVVADSRK